MNTPSRRSRLFVAERSRCVLASSAVLLVMLSADLNGFAAEPAPQPASAPGGARRFRAGAATSNITPKLGISVNGYFNDRKAAHIHDELHARCLVLDDGSNRLAFAVCDSCMIPRSVMDAAKAAIGRKTGLSPDHVMISATHTHTAPTCTAVFQSDPDREYQEFLASRIADGVVRAINNLAPARIAWGVGKEPGQVFNRRWKMRPGSIPPNPLGGTNDQVRMNPPIESPDLVEPAGPTDPDVSLVSVQSSDEGRPIALLANYSLHYVGTDRSTDISADYFGAFASRIQQLLRAERLDPPFVAILANGTSGDINNINFRKKRAAQSASDQMNAVAEAVAAAANKVVSGLMYRDWVSLDSRQEELRLGVRKPDETEVKRAQEILAKAGGNLSTAEQIYARETVLIKDYPDEVPVIIQAFRIGDLAIAAIPCEVFAETGLIIKQKSPFAQTFTIELANGYNGYLPTPAQHRLGGYETWRARSSYLEVDAEAKISETVLAFFSNMSAASLQSRR
jgi:neutral ceramidase